MLSDRWRRFSKRWAPIVGLTALAGALRFLSLGCLPPGLYHDEAINGLDALQVLKGSFPVYFAANHGREPLFIYLVAATVRILGRTPGAIRVAAACCGTLTVPATYWMTRSWFKRSTALLSSAVIGITLWHIHLSRTGFRAVALPLVAACFLGLAGRALRTQRPLEWALTGVLYGLLFYTYVAARFTPITLLFVAAYFAIFDDVRRLWPGAAYLGLGAAVALVPLGLYAVNHWDVFMGRPGQVSILNPIVHGDSLWRTLGEHVTGTLRMFFLKGDEIPRHNVPGRPVFAVPMGAAMVVGTVEALRRARRKESGSALVLIWVTTMLVPTVAAADAPHFLRAVGVLPVLAILPALGLDALRRSLGRRDVRVWGSLLTCLVLAFSVGATIHDYFLGYGESAEARYAFESAATDLAAELNRFTGRGWDGRGLAVASPAGEELQLAYVDDRLWQAWESVSFLVPDDEAVVRFRPKEIDVLDIEERSLVVVWPHGDLQATLAPLPHPIRVEVHAGPLARGDLEENAYSAYAAYYLEPIEADSARTVARFGDVVDLVGYRIEPDPSGWRVRLDWRALRRPAEDYAAFVYICEGACDGMELLAQDDAAPGTAFYPTRLWHRGDVVVDSRYLELHRTGVSRPNVGVGLYSWPAVRRLDVTEPPGSRDGVFLLPLDDG